MQKNFVKALLGMAVAALVSCGTTSEQAAQTVGAAGGRVTLKSGLELEVPAGALSDDTVVTVREVRNENGEREIEVEPRGTTLATPGTLSMPDDSGGEVEAREVEHGGTRPHRRQNGRVEVEIERFEHLHIGRRGSDDSDAGVPDDHGGDTDGGVDDHGVDLDAGTDDHGGATANGAPGAACIVDDTCACGSECVSGACTAIVTCTTDADCTGGARCREGKRSGVACGVSVCHL